MTTPSNRGWLRRHWRLAAGGVGAGLSVAANLATDFSLAGLGTGVAAAVPVGLLAAGGAHLAKKEINKEIIEPVKNLWREPSKLWREPSKKFSDMVDQAIANGETRADAEARLEAQGYRPTNRSGKRITASIIAAPLTVPFGILASVFGGSDETPSSGTSPGASLSSAGAGTSTTPPAAPPPTGGGPTAP